MPHVGALARALQRQRHPPEGLRVHVSIDKVEPRGTQLTSARRLRDKQPIQQRSRCWKSTGFTDARLGLESCGGGAFAIGALP